MREIEFLYYELIQNYRCHSSKGHIDRICRRALEMDIQQMENILCNLTNLESSFKDLSPNINYNDFQTYQRFLEHFFIQKHNLQSIYWQQVSGRSDFRPFRFLTNYTELKEDWIFFSNKVILMKQLNLPFNHMLSNDFFQCIYIMEGSAVLALEQEEKHLCKGDFFVLFPGVDHLLNTTDGTIAVNILIQKKHLYNEQFHILKKCSPGVRHWPSLELASSSYYQPDETTYILFHTLENQEIRNVVLQMFIEYLQHLDYKDQVMDCHLTLLFTYLMRYQSEQIEFSSPVTASQRAFEKICRYCQLNIENASLSGAAKELNYSKQYIGRIVKNMTGETFTSLLIGLRLELAKKYLSESTLGIQYIAEITGFSDAAHFSRVFKKLEGLSPSIYRNKGRD